MRKRGSDTHTCQGRFPEQPQRKPRGPERGESGGGACLSAWGGAWGGPGGEGSPILRNRPNTQLLDNDPFSTRKCHLVSGKQSKIIIAGQLRVPSLNQYTTSTRMQHSTSHAKPQITVISMVNQNQIPLNRLLLKDPGWVGGGGWGGQPWLTHPPTDIRKIFLGQKMKFIKGAGNLSPNVGTRTFFFGL